MAAGSEARQDGGADAPYGTWAPTVLQRLVLFLCHHTPLGRGAGRRLAARWLQALRPGPIDAKLDAQPFRFDFRDNSTDRQSLLRPSYNGEEFAYLIEGLGPDAVFVDIGANVGFFTVKVAGHCGPGCRIVAFEPNPAVLGRLRFNIAGLPGRITLIEKALGRSSGTVRFHSGEKNLGESRLSADGEIEVEMTPLLAALEAAAVTRIDALKIDVEGFEDDVLVPFVETAPRSLWPRRIVMEHTAQSNWKINCLDVLTQAGYRIVGYTRGNALLERADSAPAT